MSIVSLATAQWRARIDEDDQDQLQKLLDEAEGAILDYLKDRADPDWDEDTMPASVQAAVVLAFARMYVGREGELEGGVINETIENLLRRSRDPALA